ncbi:MAG: tRNA pseudouridine(38-40) synthase TruA [Acidimicrobiia bacterium]|nr:tRNA pseudouridine(38-40) synthase TruA [Acidimicrobiia bacterium]MDH5614951.1 tRNA pseudouridine(38-40) synthase TruA [Acidimicrobiia bacterium]
MPTYRLDLGYDGSGFHGYAVQAGLRTVQAVLEEALFKITGPVQTTVAGRTDAGVHARGQVVSFACERELDEDRTARSLNKMVREEIVIRGCRMVPDEFNARFSARSRTYRYRVANVPLLDPLIRHTVWHVRDPLDLSRMNMAAGHFIGLHDFASFCRKAEGRSTERSVLSLDWARDPADGHLVFEITASSFCRHMVRSLVAVCVDAGREKLEPEAVPDIIAVRDRSAACGAAPPQGLTLWEISYE